MSSTTGRHAGASRATASSKRGPAAVHPPSREHLPCGDVQGLPVHGDGPSGTGEATGLRRLDGPHVPGRQLGTPPADGHDGQVDRRSCHGGEVCHRGIEVGVTGDPDDSGRTAHEVAVGGVGPVGHRPRVVDGRNEPDGDAVRTDGHPLVLGRALVPESPFLSTHTAFSTRGQDRHVAEHLQRGDLGVVVVQVREQDGVRALPRQVLRPATPAPQDAVVPPQQRVGDDPRAIDVQDDGGVAEPGEGDGHCRLSQDSRSPARSPAPPSPPGSRRRSRATRRRPPPSRRRWRPAGPPGLRASPSSGLLTSMRPSMLRATPTQRLIRPG